jgi:hypothetical protein
MSDEDDYLAAGFRQAQKKVGIDASSELIAEAIRILCYGKKV